MRNDFYLAYGKQKNNIFKLKTMLLQSNLKPINKKPSTDIYDKVLRTGLRPVYWYEDIGLYFSTDFLAAPLSAQSTHSLK